MATIIWNHHEKCIQISTNMPGNGLEICEISIILRNKMIFSGYSETNDRVQSIKDAKFSVHFLQSKYPYIKDYFLFGVFISSVGCVLARIGRYI